MNITYQYSIRSGILYKYIQNKKEGQALIM